MIDGILVLLRRSSFMPGSNPLVKGVVVHAGGSNPLVKGVGIYAGGITQEK